MAHLSFETLRWTCALQDFIRGMDPEDLRRKLGLSEIQWRDTLRRLQALAGRFAGS
jgi:integrase/recombinase XerD